MKDIIDYTNSIKTYFVGLINAAKIAIESIIAPVETDAASASASYAVGAKLILNDTLYNVTSAITAGDALTVGTNISVADNIITQLAALVTALSGKADKATFMEQTLAAGNTTVTFTNIPTTGTVLVSEFSADPNVVFTSVDNSTPGTLVYTFPAQQSAMVVTLKIEEVQV